MTLKQERAIAELVENRGKSVSKAMRDVGYSPKTAKNPQNLTKSKAFQAKLGVLAKANNVTIEQYMSNLGEAMKAEKQNYFTGEITPDYTIRLQANKQAEKFLGLDKKEQAIDKDTILEIASDSDEMEITKVLFKKT